MPVYGSSVSAYRNRLKLKVKMQSESDNDVRKRLLEKPRFELAAKGVFRLGRCLQHMQHSLVCKRAPGRTARHHALNDLVARAFTSAGIHVTKTPHDLTDQTASGLTESQWFCGKPGRQCDLSVGNRLNIKRHIGILNKSSQSCTGCHLPNGMTQSYLPPCTSEHTPP